MIVVTKPTSPISDVGILLGRQGENKARQIVFDLAWLIEEYGNGTAVLVHQRSKDGAPYICTATQDGSTLTWTLNNLDTAYDGWGQAELRWTVNDVLAKTLVYKTMTVRSITADSTIPDPYESWYDQMIDYIDENAVTYDAMEQAIADYIAEHPISAPVQSVNNKTGAVVLTASDVGALPSSTVIPTKTSDLQNDSGFGTYSKPSCGIPKTDLASGVQASLDKADSALQTAPVTSVNNKTGAVTLAAGDIGYDDSATYDNGTVGKELTELKGGLSDKLDAPSTAGTSGQVLTSDGEGGQYWHTPSGGGGGTSDYTDLSNKPQINSITLSGNKSLADFGITEVENLYEQLYEDLGYLNTSTGAIYSYNATYIEKASKYIPVTAGETLHYQAWASGDPHGRIAYFDSQKSFVSYEDIPNANRTSSYAYLDKDVPSNVSYIRFAYYSFGDGKACVTRSSIKTDWIPALVDTGSKIYNSSDEYDLKGINHRGYNTVAPEDTLPAYKLSAEHGFKFVETDVQFTSDGVAVLLHDTTINRTARNADGTELSSDVNIEDITYNEALDYDFGIWKGSEYAGTPIPTFEEFIVLCKQLNLHPYIELKNDVQYTEAQIKSLLALVEKYDMTQRVSWISFHLNPLYVVKQNAPFSRIGFIVSTISAKRITEAKFLRTQYNETFLDANISNLTSELVALVKASGVPLEVYSTNYTADMLALDEYISGVTSDLLDFQKVIEDSLIGDTVTGSTPSIIGIDGHRYICGECSTLDITAPASGCIDVIFESGSTATVLTVTSAKTGVSAIKWANGFNPSSLDANTTYEINILDGEYGVGCSWT